MMKKTTVITALFAAAMLSVSGQELNFDQALAKMEAGQKKVIAADNQCKVSKDHSIRVGKKGMLRTVVKLEPNAKYVLTFSVKGEGLADQSKGGRIMVNNGKHWQRITCSPKNDPETGTFDWREGKGVVNTKNFKEETTAFILSCGAEGTIWYDKLELKKMDASPVRK